MKQKNKIASGYSGAVPNLNEVGNKRLRKLTKILKGRSDRETLSNVLEWQEKNLQFWSERWPIALLTIRLIQLVLIVILAFILIFLAYCLYSFPVSSFELVLPFLSLMIAKVIISVTVVLSICIVMTLVVIITLLESNKILNIESLCNVFKPGIPIKWLLEHKLAVCRDYAKFATCLLWNLYPNNNIYLALAPYHVAAGINIDGKIYILDQRLPLYTIEKWGKRYNKKETKFARIVSVNGVLGLDPQVPKPSFKSNVGTDMRKLSLEVEKLLKLGEVSAKGGFTFDIVLKNGASRYEDDEIINYSFARVIRDRISKELAGSSHKVVGITIKQSKKNEKDLVLYCTAK